MAPSERPGLRARLFAVLAVPAGGLGALGAIHSACHAACTAVIASLAVAGISAGAMPLAFLLDPSLVIAFASMGVVSVTLSLYLGRRHGRSRSPRRARVRLAFLGVFGALSLVSLAFGIRDTVATAAPPTGAVVLVPGSQDGRAGGVSVEVRYEGRLGDLLRFEIKLGTIGVDVPAGGYDLGARSTLLAGGRSVGAAGWRILDYGHMGHHPRGRLVFPATVGGKPVLTPGTRAVLVLRGLPKELRFSWRGRPASA